MSTPQLFVAVTVLVRPELDVFVVMQLGACCASADDAVTSPPATIVSVAAIVVVALLNFMIHSFASLPVRNFTDSSKDLTYPYTRRISLRVIR
ncbi:hypothetical protein [Microtetraspora fusca]|uniref:Secreted peptide n=1 Tax=Microtetraspora fusca TaxID=1997 RepID=A0ABW6V0B7_MICFU|nr:hypothetical protein [Microtetraspora fusca]